MVECLTARTYCIYCDKHWEDHETFFETEDVRAQNGLPVGKSYLKVNALNNGAQWLSGRVLDSRPRGRQLEPHRRHCIVVLEQDTFILA